MDNSDGLAKRQVKRPTPHSRLLDHEDSNDSGEQNVAQPNKDKVVARGCH